MGEVTGMVGVQLLPCYGGPDPSQLHRCTWVTAAADDAINQQLVRYLRAGIPPYRLCCSAHSMHAARRRSKQLTLMRRNTSGRMPSFSIASACSPLHKWQGYCV